MFFLLHFKRERLRFIYIFNSFKFNSQHLEGPGVSSI